MGSGRIDTGILGVGIGQLHAPAALSPEEEPPISIMGGWMGPRTCPDNADITKP
jgi:hypothetical protein